tara:strand:+ start:13485 stop:14324 length:840 start_codon:yes stop_codon:yes gene_type:complete
MSGGGSYNQSKAGNQSNFNQSIPRWQSDALTKMYGAAANTFGSTGNAINAQTPGVQSYINQTNAAAMPEWKNQLAGGVYQGMDNANALSNSLQQSLSNPTATSQIYGQMMGGQGNNYADAMKASYLGDANRATDNMLANLDSRAAASGMSGGSRHGVATSQGMYDINSNLQKNLAQTGYDTFDKDLANKLNIAQQADQGTLARQQMMSGMLGQQQGVQTGALNAGGQMQNLGMGSMAPTMMPWQNMSNYANSIGSPTVLSSGGSSGNSSAMGVSAGGGK